MSAPKPESKVEFGSEFAASPKVDVTMPEVDSIQVIEDHDTRGDERFPPVRRPPVFPQVVAPPPESSQS
ncbi:MAG TPA: hypothetical protein VFV87_04050 [Pirellulaceae bacterium]|nr:hypothetical protein [Pirellulaceae bacterium]